MKVVFDPESRQFYLIFPDASDDPWPLTPTEVRDLRSSCTDAMQDPHFVDYMVKKARKARK